MANAKPDYAPRWICPECDCGSHARELKASDVGALAGVLLECPACEIGSPLDEWQKTPRTL
jgi:hypothetical protein